MITILTGHYVIYTYTQKYAVADLRGGGGGGLGGLKPPPPPPWAAK